MMDVDRVEEIIQAYGAKKSNTLAILQDIQHEFSYLPREALELAAERLEAPLSEIFSIATFFKSFSLKQKGQFVCRVCLGTACYVRGARRILDSLESQLDIRAGETTDDGMFTLEAVRCVGACALGPVVVVNDESYGDMTPDKAIRLIDRLKQSAVVEQHSTAPEAGS